MAPSYERDNIWITRLVSEGHEDGVGKLTGIGTATAASVPLVLVGIFLFLTRGTIGTHVAIAQLLVAILGVVGPAFIWYYDERLYPKYAERMSDVVADKSKLVATGERYHELFADNYGYVVVLWTPFLVGVCLLNMGFFRAMGIDGVTDPAFVVYLAFVLWMGMLTGVGLHMAIVSVLFIRQVGRLELVIDPLHPDGFGGLSSIGKFTIWTTLLISIGSLGFPLAFAMAAEGGYSSAVYAAVSVYIVVLLLSFVYPTVYINRRANEARNAILDEKRARIRELRNRILNPSPDDTEDLGTLSTQLDVMKEQFRTYKDVTLYPLSVSLITRLASSVLLPLFFFGLELYLG